MGIRHRVCLANVHIPAAPARTGAIFLNCSEQRVPCVFGVLADGSAISIGNSSTITSTPSCFVHFTPRRNGSGDGHDGSDLVAEGRPTAVESGTCLLDRMATTDGGWYESCRSRFFTECYVDDGVDDGADSVHIIG